MSKFVEVKDSQVRMIWKCEACLDGDSLYQDEEHSGDENGEVAVSPDFYQDNGTPMCSCGEDMVYLRTEVEVFV